MITKEQLPQSGFYAVIFASEKSENLEGYAEMDEQTMQLASRQEGYLGYETVINANKTIFISYWKDLEAIHNWRINALHKMAKSKAEQWYKRYLSQICRVEQHHLFEK